MPNPKAKHASLSDAALNFFPQIFSTKDFRQAASPVAGGKVDRLG
jgi:hypothetical protein